MKNEQTTTTTTPFAISNFSPYYSCFTRHSSFFILHFSLFHSFTLISTPVSKQLATGSLTTARTQQKMSLIRKFCVEKRNLVPLRPYLGFSPRKNTSLGRITGLTLRLHAPSHSALVIYSDYAQHSTLHIFSRQQLSHTAPYCSILTTKVPYKLRFTARAGYLPGTR